MSTNRCSHVCKLVGHVLNDALETKSLILKGLNMRVFAAGIKLFNLVRILLANLIRCHGQNPIALFMGLSPLESVFQLSNLRCHDVLRILTLMLTRQAFQVWQYGVATVSRID